jgi:ubiquinone/menaquinone biosynthesis C-methylase UbiE
MEEEQYAEFGKTHFGSVSRSKLARIRQDAGESVLDVGCGPGLYLEALAGLGFKVTGVDASSVFVNQAAKTGAHVETIDLQREKLTLFEDAAFETVLMLDILEHVSNDVELLKDGFRVCKKNVIITVPARMSEAFDNSQLVFGSCVDPTHLRYYSMEDLRRLFDRAGIKGYKIEVGLRFDPVLYSVFPKYLRYPLAFLNRALLKVSDRNLFATVWYAVGWR